MQLGGRLGTDLYRLHNAVRSQTMHMSVCRSSSLTAPNGPSQKALVGIALDFAESSSKDVGYVAIHGTGTPLGDPIEVGALAGALSQSESSLCLGSVKVSILTHCLGHAMYVQTDVRQPALGCRLVNKSGCHRPSRLACCDDFIEDMQHQ